MKTTMWIIASAAAGMLLAAPASAAIDNAGETVRPAGKPAAGIQLAHGTHPNCAWASYGWHYHSYGRRYACSGGYGYQPRVYQPRCYWDRWGRWVCTGY